MTSAQAKRSRLEVWQDILAGVGGTVRHGDSLYRTVRKVAIALGVSYTPSQLPSFRKMATDILAARPGVYSADGKMNGNLLPQAGSAMRWGIEPDPTFGGGAPAVTVIGGEYDGDILGGEGGEQIGAES